MLTKEIEQNNEPNKGGLFQQKPTSLKIKSVKKIVGEIHEFSFNEGVEEIIGRIEKLLKNQKCTVVAFSSTDTSVGKTTLVKELITELTSKGNIFVTCFHNLRDITEDEKKKIQDISMEMEKEKVVIIVDQLLMGYYDDSGYKRMMSFYNQYTAKTFDDVGWGIKKIDFVVGIYRSDRLFGKKVTDRSWTGAVTDVIIRNELADDTDKFKS